MAKKSVGKKPDVTTTPFHSQLKRARLKAGYRYAKDFAPHVGAEPPTYRSWERGPSEPDYATLLRICQQLKLTPNDLLLGKPPGEIK